MYGESIASSSGMDRVRPQMGVCPQFDVLWDNLTGLEHLHLFAAIKGEAPAALPSMDSYQKRAAAIEGWAFPGLPSLV